MKLSSLLQKIFDAGRLILIPVTGRLQCQLIRQRNHIGSGRHSRPVLRGYRLLSLEHAYPACVYHVLGLMQEELLEKGPIKTLVITGERQDSEMMSLELEQYREQRARKTSPTKGGNKSGSPQKRLQAPDEEQKWSI